MLAHLVKPPASYCLVGVMEHDVGSYEIDLGDGADQLRPGVVRILRQQDSFSDAISRSNEILDTGAELIPCLTTPGYTTPEYIADAEAWMDGLNRPPRYFECGNEPIGNVGGAGNYMAKLHQVAPSMQARGIEVALSSFIGTTTYSGGGTGIMAMINAVEAGEQGVTHDDFQGMAIHPYSTTPGSMETLINNRRKDYAGTGPNHTHAGCGFASKWISITEYGWPEAITAEWAPSATALNGAHTLPTGTILVNSVSTWSINGRPQSGDIIVGGQRVSHTGYTASPSPRFTGCTGGSGVENDNADVSVPENEWYVAGCENGAAGPGGSGNPDCEPNHLGTPTIINQTTQANYFSDGVSGSMERVLPRAAEWNLTDIVWFAHADYGTHPAEDGYAHFGFVSIPSEGHADNATPRQSYYRFRDFQPKRKIMGYSY